jgi:Rieske Fe-S protein
MCPADDDWCEAPLGSVDRRTVLLGGSAALAAGVSGPDGARASTQPDLLAMQPGDRIQLIKGPLRDQLLTPDMLVAADAPIEAFPFSPADGVLRRKNRLNRLLVLKLDPAEMDADTAGRQASGVLAFSAICTHRGCTVSSWMQEERFLRCHCHLSQFDALSSGNITRGPARRALPMVPLALDAEGYIVAAGDFIGRVGPDQK